jgi:hypothetical protein
MKQGLEPATVVVGVDGSTGSRAAIRLAGPVLVVPDGA